MTEERLNRLFIYDESSFQLGEDHYTGDAPLSLREVALVSYLLYHSRDINILLNLVKLRFLLRDLRTLF